MAGRADVANHLDQRHLVLADVFGRWAEPELDAGGRAELLADYFSNTDIGGVQRIGAGNSVVVKPTTTDPRRATILVVNNHDVSTLPASAHRAHTDRAILGGRGIGSRFAPTVAFTEGFLAARARLGEPPLNINFLSIGQGDRFDTVISSLFTGNVDAVFVTNAVEWDPTHPTITVGSRGQLIAELSLTSGQPAADFETAGAIRNPLAKLVEILGSLRDDRGRITLPGFYGRAQPPDPATRAGLAAEGHDPNAWADGLDAARPSAALSALERATLWPVVSVLAVESDVADRRSTPGSARATIALYLVPDQRHAEIEASLRSWFEAHAPDNLHPSVKLVSSSRPYRTPPDAVPVAAQVRAAMRVHGREPLLVPAGGPAGAGEIAFAVGAPVGFAGLCGPQHGYGTAAETLTRTRFDLGVSMAAETCLQLRRV